MSYVYRCEKCNMIIHPNRKYEKSEKCPYCNERLKITYINENGKFIDLREKLSKLNTLLPKFQSEIPKLKINERNQLIKIVNESIYKLKELNHLLN